MTKLDPRINAYRDDLAAAYLQNRVRAARYVEGEIRQVCAPSVAIRVAPAFDAEVATEALSGELVTLFDARDGWAWVQLQADRYVGYTTLDGLSAVPEANTHRVSARLTHLYPAPDMKRPPFAKLSFYATVAVMGRQDGRFWELSRGGFIFADHIVGIRERVKDYVRVAERFVGVPYLWGGKTCMGIDCSGLVQMALETAGISCPRDTDMQIASVGEALDVTNLDAVQRGDLLFWQGHVAIAQSADWMLHASGHHMEVVVEPIRRAIERIGESHGPLTGLRRPSLDPAADVKSPARGEDETKPPERALSAANRSLRGSEEINSSGRPQGEFNPPPRGTGESNSSGRMSAEGNASGKGQSSVSNTAKAGQSVNSKPATAPQPTSRDDNPTQPSPPSPKNAPTSSQAKSSGHSGPTQAVPAPNPSAAGLPPADSRDAKPNPIGNQNRKR